MAKIKNTYTRLINVGGVDIPVGEERNVPNYAAVKDGPVLTSWRTGGVFEVTGDDNSDLLLPPVPKVETDIEKMSKDQLQAFLSSKGVPFADELKPELLELAREASK